MANVKCKLVRDDQQQRHRKIFWMLISKKINLEDSKEFKKFMHYN
jgi:hypothetical protein